MIFTATLTALTLSPVIVNDKAVAYSAMAEVGGTKKTVIVHPKHARVMAEAIHAGAGHTLMVRREGNLNILVGSQDETLKVSLLKATAEDRAAQRAADPLGSARDDLVWAEQMLRCARADVIRGELPDDHIARHEAEVARLTQIVSDLSA